MQTESYTDLIKAFNDCTKVIANYTMKYGMDYLLFCNTFHQLSQPLFEKEEDSADWKAELKQLEIINQKLACT